MKWYLGQTILIGSMAALWVDVAIGNEAKPNPINTIKDAPMVGDGQAIELSDLGLVMTPPTGWEWERDRQGMTLVMEKPMEEKTRKDHSTPKYRPNITLSVIHQPAPIDETRANELATQLTDKYGKNPLVKNFEIFDRKFIDHRAKSDAIVLFSRLNLREFEMMQMHVLYSSDTKQFLTSYTDFAPMFEKTDGNYAAAWQAMTSVNFEGFPEKRYTMAIRIAAVAGGLLLLFILFRIHRRRKVNSFLDEASDAIYSESSNWGEDTPLTRTGVWNLKLDENDLEDFAWTAQAYSRVKEKKARNLDQELEATAY